MAAPKDFNTDAALASVISKQGSMRNSSKEENSTALKLFSTLKMFSLFSGQVWSL